MATVYIAPTAQGSADGTSEANAYAIGSLSTAESDAGVGGIIYFLDGDYSVANFDATGVTYQSLNRHGARIGPVANGSTTLTYRLDIGTGTTSSIAVKDFQIRNSEILISSSNDSSSPLVIEGNLIYTDEAKNFGVNFGAGAGGVIWVRYSNSEVRFYNNIYRLKQGGNTAPTIFNNTGLNVDFERNTFHLELDSGSTTANTGGLSGASSCKNNIFQGAGSGTFSSTFTANATNCCFHNFGSSNASGGTNNVFADPQFVDVVNNDLRLRPSSPCINAGTAS